jgi:DNA-binding HxlR family transcriptional regulator
MMMLRTPEQRKTLCKSCGVAKAADLVGDSTSILIIRDLLTDAKYYSELQKSLSCISTRTLTKKLQVLERDGVLERTAAGNRVQYALTRKGAALKPVLNALRDYGKKYL